MQGGVAADGIAQDFPVLQVKSESIEERRLVASVRVGIRQEVLDDLAPIDDRSRAIREFHSRFDASSERGPVGGCRMAYLATLPLYFPTP